MSDIVIYSPKRYLVAMAARQSAVKRFFFKLGAGMQPVPFGIPEGGLPLKFAMLIMQINSVREASLASDRQPETSA